MPDRFTRTVVCNTGPLLALSRVGQVGLLARLFPEVIVPMEVIEELLQTPHGDVAILRRELAQFRQLTTPAEPDPLLSAQLDAGEAAVLATAMKLGHLPVLLDERKGRRIATHVYHLPLVGTGGLLVAAKQRGLIPQVRPLLDGMVAAGYHLGPILIAECLRRAKE
jgi:uncharacterized protein